MQNETILRVVKGEKNKDSRSFLDRDRLTNSCRSFVQGSPDTADIVAVAAAGPDSPDIVGTADKLQCSARLDKHCQLEAVAELLPKQKF